MSKKYRRLKKKMDNLERRVAALENKKPEVPSSGIVEGLRPIPTLGALAGDLVRANGRFN